ncbi:WD40 repeat-like protein [Dipodascopsis tothii]|uniref:WD40 repeat-like protein n=1 Tax=Dipodascopsis tothii TaxID=44089 RepID=UPI0034CF0427
MRNYTIRSVVHASSISVLYSVTFYPHTRPGDEQIFATVGDGQVVIMGCGPTGVRVLACYTDENPDECFCSCCWTTDDAGAPLLAAGGKCGVVKLIDCGSGRLVQTLAGHGDEIFDMQTCPTAPHIIASSSGDHTVRLWSTAARDRAQPCAVVCAGDGHREQVLTIAFHDSGRFLLSGGVDNSVKLWCLPDLATLAVDANHPVVLHWPHFSTSSVHSNYVDSVAFYGDLVLSRAAKEFKIVLWRISGFDSTADPAGFEQTRAPTNHDKRDTRSAFGDGFERLLQLSIPLTEPWYMRFARLAAPGQPPLLAMGNDRARVLLWNLAALELDARAARDALVAARARQPSDSDDADDDHARAPTRRKRGRKRRGDHHAAAPRRPKRRSPDDCDDDDDDVDDDPARRPALADPFAETRAHLVLAVPRCRKLIRGLAFSPAGEYLVGVGDGGLVAMWSGLD